MPGRTDYIDLFQWHGYDARTPAEETHRQDPPRPAAAGNSRLNSKVATEGGPQIDLEYLYRVVDVLDRIAAETGKSMP